MQLPDKRILVVLVSVSGIIHNKVVRVADEFSQDELNRTASYLNVEFHGKSLMTIRSEIVELMKKKALYDHLLENAVLLCERSLEGEETTRRGLDGASNILSKPDFDDVDRMRDLFKCLREKSRLSRF